MLKILIERMIHIEIKTVATSVQNLRADFSIIYCIWTLEGTDKRNAYRTFFLGSPMHSDGNSIGTSTGKQILSTIGLILVSIWQFHWKCCIEDMKWISDACVWAIRRNRWRWSMQLHFEEVPVGEQNELIAIVTSWIPKLEELRITAYARKDDLADSKRYGTTLPRLYVFYTQCK